MEREKGRSGCNRMILVHLNVQARKNRGGGMGATAPPPPQDFCYS